MDNPKEYPIGPLAESVPPLSPEQHAALVLRIAQHGLRPDVIVWREEIIFGVALLKAYEEAGVEPRFEGLADDADPTEALAAATIPFLEMDKNARGRAAWTASEWSTRGRPRDEDQNSANVQNKTRAAMAERYGVSVRLVNCFAQVLSEQSQAVPALRQAVKEWRIKGTDGARVVSRPAAVQERAVELVMSQEVRTVSRAVQRVEREMTEAAEAEALAAILAQPLDETMTLHVAQVADMLRLVPADSFDAIITHPPHDEHGLFLYSDLAALAAHALKPSGLMAVLGSGMLLPNMLAHLEHEGLRWIMEQDVLYQGPPASSGRPHFLDLHRKPLLVYGKSAFRPAGVDDLITVPPPEELPAGLDRNETAMDLIVRKLCRPGQTVCDPLMLDRAGTALGARKRGCTFIGATEHQSCLDRIRKRLMEAEVDVGGKSETGSPREAGMDE